MLLKALVLLFSAVATVSLQLKMYGVLKVQSMESLQPKR